MHTNSLQDSFGRRHTYLRLSVTDRCNLRCSYCMPEEGIPLKQRSEILSFQDIERLVRIAAGLGVTKVRLTGGEPLIRKDLPTVIKNIASIEGIEQIGITTNGVLLGKFLPELKEAGISSINISLDTLQRERFKNITNRDDFEAVWNAIETTLKEETLNVKINVVIVAGMNDDELLDFIEYTRKRRVTVRFIEYMPFKNNGWDSKKLITYSTMRKIIDRQYILTPVPNQSSQSSAKLFQIPEFTGKIGFITSISNHFCDTCNRLRITADGGLKSCLFLPEELNIREAIRTGTDEVVVKILQQALVGKPKEHFSIDALKDVITHSMNQIGG